MKWSLKLSTALQAASGILRGSRNNMPGMQAEGDASPGDNFKTVIKLTKSIVYDPYTSAFLNDSVINILHLLCWPLQPSLTWTRHCLRWLHIIDERFCSCIIRRYMMITNNLDALVLIWSTVVSHLCAGTGNFQNVFTGTSSSSYTGPTV